MVPRARQLVLLAIVALPLCGGLEGQEPPPGAAQKKAARPPAPATAEKRLEHPYETYCRTLYYTAKRGARWLESAQRPDGLFVYGWIPSLNRPLPGDNYLRQAGAAAALARAATVTGDEAMALSARQAIVVLLDAGTDRDAKDATLRRPTVLPTETNPVGFSALVLLAISELPAPNPSITEQGERLARFLASRQRPDGSINVSESLTEDLGDAPEAIDYYPGEALYALMRSHVRRPQPYKLETVRKAFEFYRRHWKEHRSPAFVPWQSAAYTEALLATKEKRFGEFVLELNDWLIQLQYVDPASREKGWLGGFGEFESGMVLRTPPGASTGSYAESLVEACRAARFLEDHARLEQYRQRTELAFAFLAAHQYTAGSTTHYAEWFRKRILGAFAASVEDGSIRIDYTQHAICAMFHYLSHVAPYRNPDQAKFMLDPQLPKAN